MTLSKLAYRGSLFCAVFLSTAVHGQLDPPDNGGIKTLSGDHHLLETRVEAEAPTSAASAETVRERDLILRQPATPEDILRVVPGLVIAQQQGGGKARQLFL